MRGVRKDNRLINALLPVIRVEVRHALQSHLDLRLVGKVNDDRTMSIERALRKETTDLADALIVPVRD